MRERLVAAEHIPVPAHESTTGPGRPFMSSLSSVILLAHAHAHEFPQVSSSQALPSPTLPLAHGSGFTPASCRCVQAVTSAPKAHHHSKSLMNIHQVRVPVRFHRTELSLIISNKNLTIKIIK